MADSWGRRWKERFGLPFGGWRAPIFSLTSTCQLFQTRKFCLGTATCRHPASQPAHLVSSATPPQHPPQRTNATHSSFPRPVFKQHRRTAQFGQPIVPFCTASRLSVKGSNNTIASNGSLVRPRRPSNGLHLLALRLRTTATTRPTTAAVSSTECRPAIQFCYRCNNTYSVGAKVVHNSTRHSRLELLPQIAQAEAAVQPRRLDRLLNVHVSCRPQHPGHTGDRSVKDDLGARPADGARTGADRVRRDRVADWAGGRDAGVQGRQSAMAARDHEERKGVLRSHPQKPRRPILPELLKSRTGLLRREDRLFVAVPTVAQGPASIQQKAREVPVGWIYYRTESTLSLPEGIENVFQTQTSADHRKLAMINGAIVSILPRALNIPQRLASRGYCSSTWITKWSANRTSIIIYLKQAALGSRHFAEVTESTGSTNHYTVL